MIKKFTSCTLFALAAVAVSAAPISRQQAAERANAALSRQGININVADMQAMPNKAQGTHTTTAPAYYIFNGTDNAVIAAGDDRMPAVLGYLDEGTIDPDNMPDGLKGLLECYAIAVENQDWDAFAPTNIPSHTAISPLIKSKWDQGEPFNTHCPPLNDGSLPYTGCNATALAQVMNYHKWPTRPTQNIPAYTTRTQNLYCGSLLPDRFPSWSNILDYYAYNQYNTIQSDAVSMLMRYVGQALQMDYERRGSHSTPTDMVHAMVTYFDYDRGAHYVYRKQFLRDTWYKTIFDELQAKRPVVYCGFQLYGGHSFIVDGYNGNSLFHVNWGWYGLYNGYFNLLDLNPAPKGIVDDEFITGFVNKNGMIIGLTPSTSASARTKGSLTCSFLFPSNGTSYSRISSPSFPIYSEIFNTYGFNVNGDFGFGTMVNGQISTILGYTTCDLAPGEYLYEHIQCDIPPAMANGNYTVVPIFRAPGSSGWKRVPGDALQLNLIVESTKYFITPTGLNSSGFNYTIDNIKVSEPILVNHPVTVELYVTNHGGNTQQVFNLFVCENFASHIDEKLVSHGLCEALPGETQVVTMQFVPETTGTKTLRISPTVSLRDTVKTPISKTITVAMGNAASLTRMSSLTIRDLVGSVVYHDKIEAHVILKNIGTRIYEDYINAYLYRRTTSGMELVQSLAKPFEAREGTEKSFNFIFDDVEDGETYYVEIMYHDKDKLRPIGHTDYFTMNLHGTKPAEPGDVDGNGTTDVLDVSNLIDVLLGIANASKYEGRANINNDPVIDIKDLNDLVNIILGK